MKEDGCIIELVLCTSTLEYCRLKTCLLCSFTFWIPCSDDRCDCRIKTMFGSSLLPVICWKAHVLFTSLLSSRIVMLFLFVLVLCCCCCVYSSCVVVCIRLVLLFAFVLCCCCLYSSCVVVFIRLVLLLCVFVLCCCCFYPSCVVVVVCIRLVYPMLSLFLDCPFWIASTVFSNVYCEQRWLNNNNYWWGTNDDRWRIESRSKQSDLAFVYGLTVLLLSIDWSWRVTRTDTLIFTQFRICTIHNS